MRQKSVALHKSGEKIVMYLKIAMHSVRRVIHSEEDGK